MALRSPLTSQILSPLRGLTLDGSPGIPAVAGYAIHFLGDSMLDSGLLVDQVELRLNQSHPVTEDGVGGSSNADQKARFTATPARWGDSLVICDAGVNGGQAAVDTLDLVTSGRRLFIEMTYGAYRLGSTERNTINTETDIIKAAHPSNYIATYAEVSLHNDGSTADLYDIEGGLTQPSLLSDLIHPNAAGRAVFGEIIAGAIIGKGWDGARAPINRWPAQLSRVANTITAAAGYWSGYPAPTITRKWYKDAVEVVGETGVTYVVDAAPVDVTVTEFATNASGSANATSAALAVNALTSSTLKWNPADKHANITLTESDRLASTAIAAFTSVRSVTSKSTGKWYVEIESVGGTVFFGFASSGASLATHIGDTPTGFSYYFVSQTAYRNGMSAGSGSADTVSNFTNSSTARLAIDFDAGKIWIGCSITGVPEWAGADPSTGTDPNTTFTPNTELFVAASMAYDPNGARLNAAAVASAPTGFTLWNL